MPATLVILTTHFGSNFSGGSTATCRLFERLENRFKNIIVIGTELGKHPFARVEFRPYQSTREALQILNSLAHQDCIFYGDFYNSVIYTRCNIPFYFTYHDNWPELGRLSLKFRLQGIYYWWAYRRIFRQAQHVFTVSKLKYNQVRAYTQKVTLARNGVQQCPAQHTATDRAQYPRCNILMVGNIDQRKYAKAAALFKLMSSRSGRQRQPEEEFSIDIYGHIHDARLAAKLQQYPWVNLKHYHAHIPYHRYRLLLHTSLMENLSIVWCEAILHATTVLTFDVGAAREVVTDGFGQCIPCYDLEQMHSELLRLLKQPVPANDAQHSMHLSEFRAQFNWDSAAQLYDQVLFEQ